MTSTDKMLARKDGRVGTMIFNNPERHNAVSFDMWQAAARILDDFAKDEDVRVQDIAEILWEAIENEPAERTPVGGTFDIGI